MACPTVVGCSTPASRPKATPRTWSRIGAAGDRRVFVPTVILSWWSRASSGGRGSAAGTASSPARMGRRVRILLLHHVTWSINSICHYWGRRPSPCGRVAQRVVARLPLLRRVVAQQPPRVPLLRFPRPARLEIDPGGWLIWTLEQCGLAWQVVRIPPHDKPRSSPPEQSAPGGTFPDPPPRGTPMRSGGGRVETVRCCTSSTRSSRTRVTRSPRVARLMSSTVQIESEQKVAYEDAVWIVDHVDEEADPPAVWLRPVSEGDLPV